MVMPGATPAKEWGRMANVAATKMLRNALGQTFYFGGLVAVMSDVGSDR